MRTRAHTALGTLMLAASVAAFARAAQRPAFDVASVRPSAQNAQAWQRLTPGRLDFANTPLRDVLLAAFRVERFQLAGPQWLDTANVDIVATFPESAKARLPEMLQTLLVERFGLASRVESRPIPAYELVIGKGGIAMREVEAANELEKDFTSASAPRLMERTFEPLEGPAEPHTGRSTSRARSCVINTRAAGFPTIDRSS